MRGLPFPKRRQASRLSMNDGQDARPSAPAGVIKQRGESPLQACATACNRLYMRRRERGGEQQEVNDQSVG